MDLALSLYQNLSKLVYISPYKKIISLVLYVTSPLVRVWCFRASFNLNDASFLIKIFLTECNILRFLVTLWLVVLFSKADSKSPEPFGKFDIFQRQVRSFKRIFDTEVQATATSKSQLVPSIVLDTVNPITPLWCSTRPLLQGLSATVVQILIVKFSQNVLNSSSAYPPIIY